MGPHQKVVPSPDSTPNLGQNKTIDCPPSVGGKSTDKIGKTRLCQLQDCSN